MLRHILAPFAEPVESVRDGLTTVSKCEENAYDLVCMDCQMPGLDGFEATRRIRSTPKGKSIKIIAVTAHASEAVKRKCQESGMNAFLAKPFKKRDVLALLERLFG